MKGDGEGVLASHEVRDLLRRLRIVPRYSSPADHQQNGLAEETIRRTKRDMRVNATWSASPSSFWGELASYSVFTRNNVSSLKIEGGQDKVRTWITPTMAMTKSKQFPYKLLLPFGVDVVVRRAPEQRKGTKNDVGAEVAYPATFLGYGEPTGHGGAYRVWDPKRKKVITASYNFVTANLGSYSWRNRQDFKERLLEMPVNMELTEEAKLVPEELKKYQLPKEIIAEIFPEDEGILVRDMDFTAEEGGSEGVPLGAEKPPLVPPVKSVKFVDFKILTEEKQTPKPFLRDVAAGGPQMRRSERLAAVQEPVGKAVGCSPPPAEAPSAAKPKKKGGKLERGLLDAVRGITEKDGQKWVEVHWQGYEEKDNAIIRRDKIAGIGKNLEMMVRDFEKGLKPEGSKNGVGACMQVQLS